MEFRPRCFRRCSASRPQGQASMNAWDIHICDCIFAVPREELKGRKGSVTAERRRQIVRAVIQSHGWNVL